MTGTTKSSNCHTMIPGKDEVISKHEVKVATAKAPTSKYEEGTNRNTPRANQKSPTPEMISSMAPSVGIARRCSDLLSERSAAKSIKRSFDILSKMDLSVDHTRYEPSEFCAHDEDVLQRERCGLANRLGSPLHISDELLLKLLAQSQDPYGDMPI